MKKKQYIVYLIDGVDCIFDLYISPPVCYVKNNDQSLRHINGDDLLKMPFSTGS